MTDDAPLCCGRGMSGIGMTRDDGVVLRSCASCGRHAWMSGSRELSREELIEVLRDEPAPAAAPRATRPDTVRPAAKQAAPSVDKRAELQDMLRGFTVHGTSS
jgi:hypothetical protein